MRRLLPWTLGALGATALLLAACAPAAEPAPAQQTTTQPATTTETKAGETKPAAAKPAETKPAAAKPAETKPAAAKPAAETKPAVQKPTTSVSGIPLDPAAKYGGVLKYTYQAEGPTFSPWEEAFGVAFTTGQPMMNMMIRNRTWGTAEDFNNQAYFELHPDLAKSWEQSADGKRWTFKFRDGVKWSDGTSFTCADAKWSLDTTRTGQGLKRSPRGIHFLAVQNIQCADDLTMVVDLKWPKPAFLEVVGMPYQMVFPKHIYENNTDLMRAKPPQAGTGPFLLKEWLPGEKYTLVRKEGYWNAPFPYLDGIDLALLSATAVPPALRAGRLDIGTYQGYQGAAAKTLINECKDCQVYEKAVASSFSNAVYVNHQRPPWNTPEVIEALQYALDRQKFVDLAFEGFGLPPVGGGFYPGSFWAMPPERVKQMPGFDFANPAANKEKARQILRDAGYKPGDLQLNFKVWVVIQSAIPPVVEDLEAVGIKVTPSVYESARWYTMMSEGEFDVGMHSFWIAGLDADFALYEHFYTGSDRNYGRYSNPEMNRLIDLQSQTIDPERRREIAWDAMELAWRTGAKHLLSHSVYQPIVGGRVRGYMPQLNYLAGYGPHNRMEHVWLAD